MRVNQDLDLKITQFFLKEEYDKIILFFESDLANHDNYTSIYTYLAIAYLCLGNEEKYQDILLNLILNSEEFELSHIADIIFNIGDIFYEQNKVNLAIKIYYQGLEINPFNNAIYLKISNLLTGKGEIEEAIYLWQNFISIQPNITFGYEQLGQLYHSINEDEKTIDIYQQGLTIDKNNLTLLKKLALIYINNNQLKEAKKILKKGLLIKSNDIEINGELGYLYIRQNNLKKAIKLWQNVIKDTIFQDYISWLNQSKNGSENLTINYNFIKTIENNQLEAIALNIGHLLLKQKNYTLAINYYELALTSNMEDELLYYNLILCLTFTQQRQKIPYYLQQLSLINPQKHQEIINLTNITSSPKEDCITPPKSYYKKASNLTTKENINIEYKEFKLDNIISLSPPKTYYQNIHPSFYFPSTIELPKPFIITLENGRFYLREDEASSAVITSDNYLIGDISPESPALSPNHPDSHPSKHSIFQRDFLPPIKKIQGKVVILAGLLNNVYFHWLFDILPRIKLLELANIDLQEIDYFVVDNRTNFQQETLKLWEIPEDKIIPLSFPLHLQVDRLIIPSFPGSIAWMPSWSCQYLREKILDNQTNKNEQKKRLYISRNKSSNRRLINEEDIIKILSKYNFEVVNLELLTVKQQGELLSQAEIVISPHGSGLSNLIFCPPKTKIIEIFSPNYVYPCYWLVSNLVNLNYYYLIGENLGSKHFHQLIYPDPRLEDIYLNQDHLQQLLKLII